MYLSDIHSVFSAPGNTYRGKPFWSWNGELTKEELVRQANVLGQMGFGGYFMHSRCGLITEYLGDEWFDLTNAVADASKESGLEAWLYDEDRWPSGSAGGKVTKDPQYRQKSLYLYEYAPEQFVWDNDVIRQSQWKRNVHLCEDSDNLTDHPNPFISCPKRGDCDLYAV